MGSHKRLTEIHITKARLLALRLFAYTSTVFPEEWNNVWIENIVPDLLEFGFHARKVNEFCNLKKVRFPAISNKIVDISVGDPGNWEDNYHKALNAIMHMKSFTVGNAHSDHRVIFTKSSANLITTYIKVSTDIRPEVTISIYGLVECFLNSVIPAINRNDSTLNF